MGSCRTKQAVSERQLRSASLSMRRRTAHRAGSGSANKDGKHFPGSGRHTGSCSHWRVKELTVITMLSILRINWLITNITPDYYWWHPASLRIFISAYCRAIPQRLASR